jgi:hypothetical protein
VQPKSLRVASEVLDAAERANDLRRAIKKWTMKAFRTRDVAQGWTYLRLAQSYRKMLQNLLREQ